MKLTIGKKEYEMKFGLKFIRQIDKAYTQNIEGMEFAMGLQQLTIYMNMHKSDALYRDNKGGLSQLNTDPSNDQLEESLEDVFNEGKDEELFKQVQEAMEQAPFLKRQIESLKKEQKKRQK